MGWVASVVFPNTFDKNKTLAECPNLVDKGIPLNVSVVLCHSTNFDKVLDYVLTNTEYDCLKEWQNLYSTKLSDFQKELIDDMRTDKINGVNISFKNCDTYVDFINIPNL